MDKDDLISSVTIEKKPHTIEANMTPRPIANPVSITLDRREWENLVKALRKDANLQPQLGRLAWMTVVSIEGAL